MEGERHLLCTAVCGFREAVPLAYCRTAALGQLQTQSDAESSALRLLPFSQRWQRLGYFDLLNSDPFGVIFMVALEVTLRLPPPPPYLYVLS